MMEAAQAAAAAWEVAPHRSCPHRSSSSSGRWRRRRPRSSASSSASSSSSSSSQAKPQLGGSACDWRMMRRHRQQQQQQQAPNKPGQVFPSKEQRASSRQANIRSHGHGTCVMYKQHAAALEGQCRSTYINASSAGMKHTVHSAASPAGRATASSSLLCHLMLGGRPAGCGSYPWLGHGSCCRPGGAGRRGWCAARLVHDLRMACRMRSSAAGIAIVCLAATCSTPCHQAAVQAPLAKASWPGPCNPPFGTPPRMPSHSPPPPAARPCWRRSG